MANTLGNPTSVSNKAREAQVTAQNTVLTSAPSIANPLLRVRLGSTTLVDFPLDASNPILGGAEDGSVTLVFTASAAVASGGSSSVPDNYQLIGRDNVVHFAGPVTGTEAISSGQTVDAGTITVTAPAS